MSRDNVEKMKEMIQNTEERIQSSRAYMEDNDVSGEQKVQMREKNERREEAMARWKEEIEEELEQL